MEGRKRDKGREGKWTEEMGRGDEDGKEQAREGQEKGKDGKGRVGDEGMNGREEKREAPENRRKPRFFTKF